MRIEGIDRKDRASGWEAYESYKLSLENRKNGGEQGATPASLAAAGGEESAATKGVNSMTPSEAAKGCETCKNRTYQDGSDDPGVSFKTPTKVAPEQAASAVRGHEMEHVGREQRKAQQEDREVVSQFVTYRNAICSECGKTYIAGGTTTTTTRGKSAYAQPQEESPGRFEAYA